MSDSLCKIEWPGVSSTVNWSFPFSPGIQPSTCTITSKVAHANPAASGELRIRYTNGQGFRVDYRFPDCVLEQPAYQNGEQGQSVRMPIKDRRIWWQYGVISGAYNQREADGKTLVREKDPQALAKLLLDAMGEKGYDVSQLPMKPRPAVKWIYTNPAQELDKLCQSFGCIVVLNPITNKVEIWKEGEGDEPKASMGAIGRSVGFSLLAPPEKLLLVGEPTLFQGAFYSAWPLGEDTDGKIKPINDLSYKPADGWEQTEASFYSIEGKYKHNSENRELRALAQSCVWKWYEIQWQVNPGETWSPEPLKGTEFEPTSYSDLELFNERAESIEQPDGTKKRLPAECYVKSWQGGELDASNDDWKRLKGSFSIDAKLGIIKFSEPQYKFIDGEYKPAEVIVVTAYYAGKEGKVHAYTRERKVPKGKKGTKRESQPLQRIVIDRCKFNGQRVKIEDNVDKLDGEADEYLSQLEKQYEQQDAPNAIYPGILKGSLNGRITQVTWQSSSSGTTTIVSAGGRHNPYVKDVNEQRRQNEAKEAADFVMVRQKSEAVQAQPLQKQ